MTGSERREEIISQIQNSTTAVSGKKLAAAYDVSRQVIVQDIALIRAMGYDIISTNKGYILNAPKSISKIFKVVDNGGCIENVMINHKVYGHMEANLQINSRRKIKEFMEEIRSGKSSPLKNITSGYHYHKVSADSRETLEMVEKELKRKGFLIQTEYGEKEDGINVSRSVGRNCFALQSDLKLK